MSAQLVPTHFPDQGFGLESAIGSIDPNEISHSLENVQQKAQARNKIAMKTTHSRPANNLLLVANYESDVGYAWWLMETFWLWLADLAAKQGRRTLLIYPKVTSLPEWIASSRIQVSELVFPTGPNDDLSALEEFVARNQIGVIYLTDRPYSSRTYRALRMLGVQKIINHDHTPGKATLGSLAKWIPRRIALLTRGEYCDEYIAVSNYVHRKHLFGAALPRSMCHVISNGIKLHEIPTASERERRRNSLGIEPNDLVIVSIGRADTYKGIDFLISCAKSMENDLRFSNARFLHCGGGPHLASFQEQIRKLSIGHRFRCLGHRNDISEVLSACDIAVHASPAEAGSLAILEYMGACLPVLAPRAGANPEQIANNVTGFFYKYRDEDSLKEQISRLSANDELRQRMGRAGRERVEQRFSLDRMHAQFEMVFSRLLEYS